MISMDSRTPSRRSCETPTVCLTDSSRMARPPDVAVRVRGQRVRREAGQGAVDLPADLDLVAFADQLQVDGQVAALGPPGLLGDQQPPPGQDQREARAVVRDEQPRQQPRRGGDLVPLLA